MAKKSSKKKTDAAGSEDLLEQRTKSIGRELFTEFSHYAPSVFHARWWEDRLMNWAMGDEAVKLQMFRFVDVLPMLRERFAIPFVGTVPAIKPACAESKSRLVSVLGTVATVRREYTHALIRDFAQGCDVTLVGSPRLAELAEAALKAEPVSDFAIDPHAHMTEEEVRIRCRELSRSLFRATERIAELEAQNRARDEQSPCWCKLLKAAEQRIAELEAQLDIAKHRIADQEKAIAWYADQQLKARGEA